MSEVSKGEIKPGNTVLFTAGYARVGSTMVTSSRSEGSR